MRFGGLTALDDVSFHINEGEILGLIGPNGAGKTTCFNVTTGVYQPTTGEVRFEGQSLGGLKRYQITKLGIARTFQNIRLFGADDRAGERPGRRRRAAQAPASSARCSGCRGTAARRSRGTTGRWSCSASWASTSTADELAVNLSYGDQRRLEIARAMATGPKLICLDEPAAGFNPAEKVKLMELIRKVRDQGYTVLLIEHDMRLVMGVTDRIVVLEFGRKIAEGTPSEIRDDPAVIAAYLGVDEEDAS